MGCGTRTNPRVVSDKFPYALYPETVAGMVKTESLGLTLVCHLDDILLWSLGSCWPEHPYSNRIAIMSSSFFENFVRASRQLTHALEKDCNLTEFDQLRLENHLSVIHMAYVEWKQRNCSPTYLSGPLSEESLREDREDDSRHSI